MVILKHRVTIFEIYKKNTNTINANNSIDLYSKHNKYARNGSAI